MVNLVTSDADLTTLSLEQINWLLGEAGSALQAITAVSIGTNASNEVQYAITHYSPVRNETVDNHAFVDIDAQGDPRLRMNDVEEGDLNPRNAADLPQD